MNQNPLVMCTASTCLSSKLAVTTPKGLMENPQIKGIIHSVRCPRHLRTRDHCLHSILYMRQVRHKEVIKLRSHKWWVTGQDLELQVWHQERVVRNTGHS